MAGRREEGGRRGEEEEEDEEREGRDMQTVPNNLVILCMLS